MNTNSGNDPMLSSFISNDWVKLNGTLSSTASPVLSLNLLQPSSSAFLTPTDGLLSPGQNLSELASLWSTERKRISSIKMEDDDSFSSYSVVGDVDNADIDMDEIDIGSNTTVVDIKTEIEDNEYCDVAVASKGENHEHKYETNTFHMSELAARKHVEEQFDKIAFVPRPHLSQREKIESILAKSDCTEFSVENILNFDKKCPDSARACAKIVQNIPQRYRWDCVRPEDIPCCYTIVADCKKVSSRDKPPRPMNAFMIWAQGARRLINELCPKMQNALISEALGYYWRQKNDAFKQVFEQEKMKLRRFHYVEFPEYKYKPKTKVQKAKEKQQLSLTKAKMRASVKLEKNQRTEESNICRTNTSSRPKKTRQDSGKKNAKEPSISRVAFCEKPAPKSPTRPGIKDMLSLKILNDRRCKEATNSISKSQESVRSLFGQLSPLEVLGDTTDDVGSLDSSVHIDTDLRSILVPSSVFDTPANTPPVDEGDDDHPQTPVHSQQGPSVIQPRDSSQRISLIANNQTIQTSFTPIHFLPIKDFPDLSLLNRATAPTAQFANKQRPSPTTAHVSDVTDWLFSYITESLSTAGQHTCSLNSKYSNSSSGGIDANNNSGDLNNNTSDENNNCYNDANNNNNNTQSSYPASSSTSKLIQSPNEVSDLDTLLLDLNAPFLSDDDLRSILNTL